MAIIFSGMQPSGHIHLGNYLAMVEPLLKLSRENKENKIICSIVDLHSITVWQDPKLLYENSLNLVAFLIACGLNSENSLIFLQSSIKEHTELSWLLSCTAKIGWLNRMIQFKEKAASNQEKVSCGLYFYPILMAADILLYNAELVPVGEDQKQHLEFARDLAICFNGKYNSEVFKIPKPLILPRSRIMSLKDGSKKMSKSDPNDNSKILFSDPNDLIAKKIKKSKTDSSIIEGNPETIKCRPEAYNLLNIYSLVTHTSFEDTLIKFNGQGFANLKKELIEVLINLINPLRLKYNELLKDKSYLKIILKENFNKLQPIAQHNLKIIKELIGFVQP